MIEQIKELISPEQYILVFVLYVVGKGLKASSVNNKFIPAVLGITGIVLSCLYAGSKLEAVTGTGILAAAFTGITQGLLCAGGSVYIDQFAKQLKK